MANVPKPGQLVTIGLVGAPHGVRGAVHIKTALEDPAALRSLKPLSLNNGQTMRILEVKAIKGEQAIIHFENATTREHASALTGFELQVPRSVLPETGEDVFYHADLIGLEAKLESGDVLGKVAHVHNFGAGDILEIKSDTQALMIAFSKAFVPHVDMAARVLTISQDALVPVGDDASEQDFSEAD